MEERESNGTHKSDQDCISQKHCKPKLIVEQLPMVSLSNLGLWCLWETQPWTVMIH